MRQEKTEALRVLPRSAMPSSAHPEQMNKWRTLVAIAPGVFMGNLDASIVNASLPAIAHSFGTTLSGLIEWVVIAYLMVIAGVLLTVGRLADLVGRKPIWGAGLMIFTAGSVLCGAAPNLLLLIAARGFQGLGAALLMAVGPAILTGAFPSHERGRALGLNAVTMALAISIGPTLGGLITQYFGWRGIFSVNVPIGLLGLWMAVRLLREQRAHRHGRVDLPGALCLAVVLAALIVALSFGREWGWSSPPTLGLLLMSLVMLVGLVMVEQIATHPIIDLSLFTNRRFVSANLSLLLNMLALFSVNVLVSFYLVEVRACSPAQAGLLLTPLPLTLAVLAPLTGILADRLGTRWLAAGGLAIACLGLVFVSLLNATSSILDIAWRLVVVGLGQALFQSPNSSALMGAVPSVQQGSASGFMATSRVVGQSLSVALAGTIFAAAGGAQARHLLSMHHGQELAASTHTLFLQGFHAAVLTSAAIAAVGIFASLIRGQDSNASARGR